MTHPAYDAAIVGGGPAGCSAAIHLARRGARVALIEARTYPHPKLCGEFLSPECGGLLEALGAAARLQRLGPARIDTACLTAPDGTAWETRLPGAAWGLSRAALDAALAEHASAAGADLLDGTTVTAIAGGLGPGFELRLRTQAGAAADLRARLVIGAHGKRGSLDRSLGRRFVARPQPFVALKAHFDGPPLPGRIELHAFPGGYCGMSEAEGGITNVCLLAHESAFRQAAAGRERKTAFLAWMQRQNARLGDWLSRARQIDPDWLSIGQIPFGDKRVVVGDVLMAGDAAGLIVPLAGDGIAMALRGGALAAELGAGYLSGRLAPGALRTGYAAAWRSEFGARMRLGRLLQAAMLRPKLLAGVLHLLRAVPPLGRYLVMHTRDLRPAPIETAAPRRL